MTTQKTAPQIGSLIPVALKTFLTGYYIWCVLRGYTLVHMLTGAPVNEEQLESMIDEYVKQSLQTDNL